MVYVLFLVQYRRLVDSCQQRRLTEVGLKRLRAYCPANLAGLPRIIPGASLVTGGLLRTRPARVLSGISPLRENAPGPL